MIEPGRVVGGYRVEALVATGTMGRVWRVRHLDRGTLHALKYLPLTASPHRARLLREAESGMRLSHPNVVGVTEVLDIDGDPALVMEYVNGPTLAAWLEEHRPSVADALALFRGLAAGVAHAHRAGIVHRDLKPTNVLLARTPGGLVPKVADFGLAKALGDAPVGLTRSGVALGAPAYSAPEQLRDPSSVDARADVFSLGCILYELLCGSRAFSASDELDLLNDITSGRYEPPECVRGEIPWGVSDLVRACLAPAAAERPENASEVLRRVDALTPKAEPPPPRRRSRAGVAVLGVAVAAAVTWWLLA